MRIVDIAMVLFLVRISSAFHAARAFSLVRSVARSSSAFQENARVLRPQLGHQRPLVATFASADASVHLKQQGQQQQLVSLKKSHPQVLREFKEAVKQLDRTKAFELYDKMFAENPQDCYMVQLQILSLCREAAHLPDAIRVFQQIPKDPHKLNESVFLPLIRCYIDANELNMALGLIQQMVELGVEPRMRTYQPVLETMCKLGDIERAMKLTHHIWSRNIGLREEQYDVLFNCLFKSEKLKPKPRISQLRTLLSSLEETLAGLPYEMLERFHNLINETSASHSITSTMVEVPGDKLSLEPAAWFPDSPPGTPFAITHRTSKVECPECAAIIPRKGLAADEAQRVRVALMKLASSSTLEACRQLQAFNEWLGQRPEYSVVLDGANVAYNGHQVRGQYTFKYHQILSLVETLEKHGERVLVTIPYLYTQRTSKTRKAGLEQSDIAALDKLASEDKLYVVPNGSHDDWFWMYFTVSNNRESPGLVVTNDMMRDHRLALLEPHPFIRWRASHVMRFDFPPGPPHARNLGGPVRLFPPALYSREPFADPDKGTWHIPATDKEKWLCIQFPK